MASEEQQVYRGPSLIKHVTFVLFYDILYIHSISTYLSNYYYYANISRIFTRCKNSPVGKIKLIVRLILTL